MPLTAAQLRKLRASDADGRLRAARLALAMTQVQVAEAIGLTQSTLSDLERQRFPNSTLDTARKFAEFFGCSIEDLFPSKAEAVSR